MSSAAMHIARTGLDAQDMRMRVISNNLANVNTTGFKSSRAAFETLAYQTVTAPGSPSTSESKYATGLNLGTGVRVQGTERIDTAGSMSTTCGLLGSPPGGTIESVPSAEMVIFCAGGTVMGPPEPITGKPSPVSSTPVVET